MQLEIRRKPLDTPLHSCMLHALSHKESGPMKDMLRTLFSIRTKRRAPPVGPLPQVGASIMCGGVKMQVTHPMPRELWDWMVLSGWRNVPVSNDRRQSAELPERTMKDLLDAAPTEREALHARILRQARRSA